MFSGDPAPFVMELPAYHLPTVGAVLRSMWERGWSFIKKAGTVILLATIVIWLFTGYGFENGSFGAVEDMDHSYGKLAGKSDLLRPRARALSRAYHIAPRPENVHRSVKGRR